MQNISLGDIGLAVTFLVGLISGIGYLMNSMKKWIGLAFKSELDPIKKDLDDLQKRVTQVDMESCKNYLVDFLSDVEKDKTIDEIEMERFWEQYAHYINKGGNSYIKHKVEKLEAEKRL